MRTTDYDRLATSAPADATAARVTDTRGGEHWEPERPPNWLGKCYDDGPPKLVGVPPNIISLTGKTYGRLTVAGLLSHSTGPALWLVRCSCGSYESRTKKQIRSEAGPMCWRCSRLEEMKRRQSIEPSVHATSAPMTAKAGKPAETAMTNAFNAVVDQRDRRAARAAQLWVDGKDQSEVARIVGLPSNTAVSIEIKAFLEKYLPNRRQLDTGYDRRTLVPQALAAFRQAHGVAEGMTIELPTTAPTPAIEAPAASPTPAAPSPPPEPPPLSGPAQADALAATAAEHWLAGASLNAIARRTGISSGGLVSNTIKNFIARYGSLELSQASGDDRKKILPDVLAAYRGQRGLVPTAPAAPLGRPVASPAAAPVAPPPDPVAPSASVREPIREPTSRPGRLVPMAVSVTEAGQLLGVSDATVEDLIRHGELNMVLLRGIRVIPVKALRALLGE